MRKDALLLTGAATVTGIQFNFKEEIKLPSEKPTGKAAGSFQPYPVGSKVFNTTEEMDFGRDLNEAETEYERNEARGELLKDGFTFVDCIHDENVLIGDKHGKNHLDFDDNNPISITRYEGAVDQADQMASDKYQGAMTHEKCFEFCRKVEYARFFGIINGNDCYCAPFYRKTGGTNEQCNVPCSGDASQMCGGQVKSSVFEMHGCGGAQFKHDAGLTSQSKLEHDVLEEKASTVDVCSKGLAYVGGVIAKAGGKVGNEAAMAHQQDMIMSYKQLQSQEEAISGNGNTFIGHETAAELKTLYETYDGAFSQKASPKAKEEATNALMLGYDKTIKMIKPYKELAGSCLIADDDLDWEKVRRSRENSLEFYKSVTDNSTGVCTGDLISTVKFVKLNETEQPYSRCAEKCRATIAPAKCVGFQTYEIRPGGPGSPIFGYTCSLFSAVKTLTEHTPKNDECESKTALSASCWVPVTDVTTYETVRGNKHTIGECFGDGLDMAIPEELEHAARLIKTDGPLPPPAQCATIPRIKDCDGTNGNEDKDNMAPGWHRTILVTPETKKHMAACAPFYASTRGGTCKQYCKDRGLRCIRGQDDESKHCGFVGHPRTIGDQTEHGCLQRWSTQICQCGFSELLPA